MKERQSNNSESWIPNYLSGEMKKFIVGLVLCLLFIPLLGMDGGPGEGMTRCLLIGCDRFVSMPGTEPASANNVNTMEALMKDFLPKGTRIKRQVNGLGTVKAFERLVKKTFQDARDSDTAVIYLSTHGLVREDGEQRQMALLLSDGVEEEELDPEKLRKVLNKVPGRKVLILDACHSGAVIGCGGEWVNRFEDDDCRVLVSSGAEEDSWFWNVDTDSYTGTGYFTSAMDRALRASDPGQIDPDGNGIVSLTELTARLREIHGASTVYCWPEGNGESLFRLPADQKPGDRLQGIFFDPWERDEDSLKVPVHFRVAEKVRVMYKMVPSVNGKWDFELSVTRWEKRKTGLIRGLVSPGEWRSILSIPVSFFGKDGRALLQVFTVHGDAQIPAAEAGRVITLE